MAGAIGIGLNVQEPIGNMIVDIGGGTTEIAVIALSGIVADESIRIAGDEMTEGIVQYFKRQHNILIGDRTAEQIKCEVGSAVKLEDEMVIEVKGRDLIAGIPRMIQISSNDIRDALSDAINAIVTAVLSLLERTPPELSADIFDRGIMLTGGGALLKGLDERLRRETSLPVHIADDPLTAVVRGTGKVLENLNEYSSVLIKSARY
jgi:rod shape-determining protein MreB